MTRLRAPEGRVVASLVEKALTIPQHYPLTLNALAAACNQTSSRDPVTSYDEETVRAALDSLRERRMVRAVLPSHGRSTVRYRHVLDETCIPAETHLHTDSSNAYTTLGPAFASHGTVNHKIGEYVRDGISTNPAESFFAQFKRSVTGTHHNVSREHLHRYASEFEFRWNTSKMTDAERVQAMVDATVGKRLTYRPLTDG